jgi:hypothetical protein
MARPSYKLLSFIRGKLKQECKDCCSYVLCYVPYRRSGCSFIACKRFMRKRYGEREVARMCLRKQGLVPGRVAIAGSGSCSASAFGISDVEPSGCTSRGLEVYGSNASVSGAIIRLR